MIFAEMRSFSRRALPGKMTAYFMLQCMEIEFESGNKSSDS